MPDLDTPPPEAKVVLEWLRAHMPSALLARPGRQSVWGLGLKPLRLSGRYLWLATALVVDLTCRWLWHAIRLLYSSRGYVALGLCAALYSFIYSLANEAYQRGELNASLRLSTFVSLVSGNSRASFIAAVKQIDDVQNAPSFMAPSFWAPATWFVTDIPNRNFISDWVKVVFPECTADICGNAKFRMDLSHARLGAASLFGVDLHEADLSGAWAESAELSRANFENAKLERAHFWKARLEGANFRGANLQCSTMEFVNAHPAYGDEADKLTSFAAANLRGATIEGGNFERANFDDTQFAPGKCSDFESELTRRFPDISLSGANFVNSTAKKATFRRAKLEKATLTRTNFEEADFQEADLSGADMRGANFSGANLSGAKLTGARFSVSTSWPTGYDPNAQGASLVAGPD